MEQVNLANHNTSGLTSKVECDAKRALIHSAARRAHPKKPIEARGGGIYIMEKKT